jgi:hypothetical protein
MTAHISDSYLAQPYTEHAHPLSSSAVKPHTQQLVRTRTRRLHFDLRPAPQTVPT